MSNMFAHLIPKAAEPAVRGPSDPREQNPSITNNVRGVMNQGRNSRLPADKPVSRLPVDMEMPQFEAERIQPPEMPTFQEQMTTPSLAELMASGGRPAQTMTSQDRAALQSRLRDVTRQNTAAPSLSDLFASVMDAGMPEAYVTDPDNWQPEIAVDEGNKTGTMLSRLFTGWDGKYEEKPTGRSVVMPVPAAPTAQNPAVALLEQARAAIAAGADPAQVAERLKANGVDPSQM